MDKRLEKALEFSNYMVTLNNQKRILREKFRESVVYYCKGSQFTVTKELMTFVNLLLDKNNQKNIVLIDDNEIPVMIDDLTVFLNEILDTYFSAANEYHTEYKKLLRNRSTLKLVEYEQE